MLWPLCHPPPTLIILCNVIWTAVCALTSNAVSILTEVHAAIITADMNASSLHHYDCNADVLSGKPVVDTDVTHDSRRCMNKLDNWTSSVSQSQNFRTVSWVTQNLCYLLYTCNSVLSHLSVSQTLSKLGSIYCRTSSSAVAKRPRNASCLSIVSFVASIVQYLERSFLLSVTSASDLLVRTIRFCSVVFGVTSSLVIIHTIYRDCV